MTFNKIFVDSDILLDILLKREPHNTYSRVLLENAAQSKLQLFTSSLVIANIHYLVSKNLNKNAAVNAVKYIIQILEVLSFEKAHIQQAIMNEHSDLEDSIQYNIAKMAGCNLIISRNIKHYKRFDIPVLTAEQFLRTIL